MVVGLI